MIYNQFRDKGGKILQAEYKNIAWLHKTPITEQTREWPGGTRIRVSFAGILLSNIHARTQTWSWGGTTAVTPL